MVGVPGLEPGTPSLSGMYSNQLSYRPKYYSINYNLMRKELRVSLMGYSLFNI